MMMIMVIVALVIVGLACGSFVNALVWRVHDQADLTDKTAAGKKLTKSDQKRLTKLSVVRGRSMCLHCGHELAVRDLVPVFSWLALRGKCRYCGARIPDTPLAELLVPALFVVSYLWWPWATASLAGWLLLAVWLASVVGFVALILYDARWYELPNRIVFPLIGLALAFRLLLLAVDDAGTLGILLAGLWGVLLLAGLFYLLFIVSNEQWIGGGDVKLAVALGLLAGGPLQSLLLLLVASLSGTFASVPLLVSGHQVRGVRIPFGPFLIVAVIFTVLWGQPIVDWYSGLFVG